MSSFWCTACRSRASSTAGSCQSWQPEGSAPSPSTFLASAWPSAQRNSTTPGAASPVGWEAAIDALGFERCHLVAHDIGGPVVLEWAVRNPDRVLSLTALDTMVDVARFHRPWPMHPFSIGGIGELWLRSMTRFPFREIYYLVGIGDRAAVPTAEVDAHHALLKRVDGGRAFLRIMRGFELTEEKERFFFEGLSVGAYPAQVVWGASDRMLGEDRRRAAMQALGVEEAKMLPAKHFLQEDQAQAVTEAIAGLAV